MLNEHAVVAALIFIELPLHLVAVTIGGAEIPVKGCGALVVPQCRWIGPYLFIWEV